MKKLIFVFLLAAASACTSQVSDIKGAASAAACDVVEISTTPNMFNATSASCKAGGRVYFFPTPEAKEGHAKMCAGFGGLAKSSGAHWTYYSPSC